MRVVVAMSGGVDSAVAAARLKDAGHDVVGVTLHLWDYAPGAHGRCCAPEDQYDARRTADVLGFPHYTFDRRELFSHAVIAPFVDAYLAGRTPSPCASCNRHVKLTVLFELADRLGAGRVATGHYARVTRDEGGRLFLEQGKDRGKDQSYFLYATEPEELARLVFPVGDSLKADVRREAVSRGLPGAHKGESQELCFVDGATASYASFVEERADGRVRPGPIVDEGGRVIAHHEGVHRFTVGQRKGLGVSLGKPAFVAHIDAATATVHLGGADAIESRQMEVRPTFMRAEAFLPTRALVRVRHGHAGAWASLSRLDPEGVAVTFDAPVRAVAPGQLAVFYLDGKVIGGGPIDRAVAPRSAFSSDPMLLRSNP